jgi:hypothetical protein
MRLHRTAVEGRHGRRPTGYGRKYIGFGSLKDLSA